MRSHKPTHPTPLSAAEAAVPRNTGGKGWQAGGRFVWVSHFGSKRTNTGTRDIKGSKGGAKSTSVRPERPVIVPGWARKYTGG